MSRKPRARRGVFGLSGRIGSAVNLLAMQVVAVADELRETTCGTSYSCVDPHPGASLFDADRLRR